MEAKRNSGCAISLGSLNRAIRARDLLASAALFSKVVKVDEQAPGQGCVYAIELSCGSAERALGILRRAGIKGRLLSRRP